MDRGKAHPIRIERDLVDPRLSGKLAQGRARQLDQRDFHRIAEQRALARAAGLPEVMAQAGGEEEGFVAARQRRIAFDPRHRMRRQSEEDPLDRHAVLGQRARSCRCR